LGDPITPDVLDELDKEGWELYHIEADPTESHDVAAGHPDKVRELVSLWWDEAGKYKVLPLDGSLQPRLAAERPQTAKPRTRYVYYPGGSVVPAFAAPPVFNRPYSIEADVEIPSGGAEGVLVAQGGDAGGYTFYVADGQLRYAYNYMGRDRFDLASPETLTEGRHALRYEFEPTGEPDLASGKGTPGRGQLYVDGRLVANVDFPHTTPLIFELEGLSCGYDFGSPAADGYEPPFAFTGTIHQVAFDVAGKLITDDEAEMARLMAQQ
jgi:arylsulfatase